ncbi:hypothetical protein [Tatumella sp. UBA2305]|uniref:hypothetical protein n=1 Tax=Tatumella sp. UBA2305 TaxID=1947647 RepID=UPI0025EE4206|nr:hypothetical protein [Tatumella sp. UBA2305]
MANLYRIIASMLQEKRKSHSERISHILELVALGNEIFFSYENSLKSPSGIVTDSAFISDFSSHSHEAVNLYGLPVGADRHLNFNIITTVKTIPDKPVFLGVKVEIFKESDDFFVCLGTEDCVFFEFPASRGDEYLSKISLVIRQFVIQLSQDRIISSDFIHQPVLFSK